MNRRLPENGLRNRSPQQGNRDAFYQGGTDITPREQKLNGHCELGQAVRDRITKQLGVRVHNLEVEVEGDSVVLSGRCTTFYTKQLAQHAALDVIASRSLDNRIEVHAGENLLTDQRHRF